MSSVLPLFSKKDCLDKQLDSKMGRIKPHDELLDDLESRLEQNYTVHREHRFSYGEIDAFVLNGDRVLLFEVKRTPNYKAVHKADTQLTRNAQYLLNITPATRAYKFFYTENNKIEYWGSEELKSFYK